MRARLLTGLLAASALAGAADAAKTTFAGTLDLRAGYGSNPYLTSTNDGGTAQFGGTLSAGLTRQETRATTTLFGTADVVQSAKRYGRSENYTLSLNRSQQLTQRFSIDAGVGYANTINPGASYQSTLVTGAVLPGGVLTTPVATTADPTLAGAVPGIATAPIGTVPITTVPIGTFNPSNLDLYTIGQRSERLSANAGANWLVTGRDQITAAGSWSRVRYKRFDGDYRQYGGSLSYLHTIDARTSVGVSGGASYVSTSNYPSARSYTANLLLNRQLSTHWRTNLSAGVIIPDGGFGQSNSVTFGFTGALCGDYGRKTVCFTAARQAAPTGIGGLRTDLQAGFTLGYQLNERDTLNAGATIDHSQGTDFVPRQNFYQASAGFAHQLSPRFSIGGSGRYQRRDGSGRFPSASGYAVTVDVITRFGHAVK